MDDELRDYITANVTVECSSSSRPQTPGVGLVIHETDTDCWLRWDGQDWIVTRHP